MVAVVKLVITPDCDSGDHGFEPRQSPKFDLWWNWLNTLAFEASAVRLAGSSPAGSA